jgi:hypothetical protein
MDAGVRVGRRGAVSKSFDSRKEGSLRWVSQCFRPALYLVGARKVGFASLGRLFEG